MAKFAAIVPDGALSSLISETAAEMNEDVLVLKAGPEEVLHAVRKAEGAGAQALIARGALCDAVRTVTSLPVVACNPGLLDVLMAVARAKEHGTRVALVHFGGSTLELQALVQSMGIELGEFTPGRTPAEVRKTLEEVKQGGYQVVVSGQVTVDMARSQGLKGVVIGIGKASVRQAVENCNEVVKSRREAEDRKAGYSEILDGLPVGVVATDPRGVIKAFNRAAVGMGVVAQSDAGRPACEAMASSPVLAALKGEQGPGVRLARIGDTRVGIEAVPWKSEGSNAGAVCVLYDVSAAERLVDQLSSPPDGEIETASIGFDDIPAESPGMRRVVERAKQYALTDAPVLVYGETGSGKEALAQAIHLSSIRASAPFGRVSCEGLAPDALERRLFGYEKGAFSAARRSAPGVFEVCHGGTVFLEEVWAMPPEIQARVAAVIEHRTSWRIGGTEPRSVDARVMASSSKKLKELVAKGEFSEALYWKIAGLQLEVPPLRERQDDIEALFNLMAARFLGTTRGVTLSQSSIGRLKRHTWPGNVRELEGLVKRLAAALRSMPLVPEDSVERMVIEEMTPEREPQQGGLDRVTVAAGTLDDMVQSIIDQFDKHYSGNRSEVARRLGISRTTLWKKMKER